MEIPGQYEAWCCTYWARLQGSSWGKRFHSPLCPPRQAGQVTHQGGGPMVLNHGTPPAYVDEIHLAHGAKKPASHRCRWQVCKTEATISARSSAPQMFHQAHFIGFHEPFSRDGAAHADYGAHGSFTNLA